MFNEALVLVQESFVVVVVSFIFFFCLRYLRHRRPL